ncbi:hypothetical protein GCM10007424_23590 [Flavobacterium suaedae]|uniref:Uncharacterized protein n=1 Tax=Flavobacterium suaedae TaxID=1767027 RepID=A0ABQ1K398_9FLAO|nr:hypothetical protein [Flavobacterium suaedae]GGB82844.1 hypothetical protein GCM10007424_23590 [Flavobacterium suaedae]
MTQEIQNTEAFKKLAKFQQTLLIKRDNRIQIQDAIIQARNIGYLEWESNNKTFPPAWKGIVKELAPIEIKTHDATA